MVISLSGLGCQNKPIEPGDVPPAISAMPVADRNPAPGPMNPRPYPSYYSRGDGRYEVSYPTHWDAVRATVCSLVLGHDPGMPTAREIEESAFGIGSGR
jgi:hypothetical protein